MKTGKLIMASLVLISMGLTGCQKDPAKGGITEGNDKVELTINADKLSGLTKTIIGKEGNKYHTAWDVENDKLGVFTYCEDFTDEHLTFNAPFSIAGELVDGAAKFTGTISCHPTEDMNLRLFAYYPYSTLSNSNNSSHDFVNCNIPAVQGMKANGMHCPNSDYMIGRLDRTIQITGGQAPQAPIDDFVFEYIVGFTNLSVAEVEDGLGVAATDAVESISMEVVSYEEQILTGDFVLDLDSGEVLPDSYVEGTHNVVTVSAPEGLTLGGLSAWFVTHPFTLTEDDEEIVFTITTATHTIEKTVVIGDLLAAKGLTEYAVVAGGVKTFEMVVDDRCTITAKQPVPAKGTVLYTENWGTASSSISAYAKAGTWTLNDNNSAISYQIVGSGTNVQIYKGETTLKSNGYPGASEGSNVLIPHSGRNQKLRINNVPLCNAEEIELSFGLRIGGTEMSGTNYADDYIVVTYTFNDGANTGGTLENPLDETENEGSGDLWNKFSYDPVSVPAGATSVTFEIGNTHVDKNMRMDDLVMRVPDQRTVSPKFSVTYSGPDQLTWHAGELAINVSANVDWTVSSNNAEFVPDVQGGTGNATVTVNYTANDSETDERNVTITVSTDNTEVPETSRTWTLDLVQFRYSAAQKGPQLRVPESGNLTITTQGITNNGGSNNTGIQLVKDKSFVYNNATYNDYVETVTLVCRNNKSTGSGTATVKVGGVSLLCDGVASKTISGLSTTNTPIIFEVPNGVLVNGPIEVSVSASANSVYVQSITIN